MQCSKPLWYDIPSVLWILSEICKLVYMYITNILVIWTHTCFEKPKYATWSILIGILILKQVNRLIQVSVFPVKNKTWWLKWWEINRITNLDPVKNHLYRDVNHQVNHGLCKQHILKFNQNQYKHSEVFFLKPRKNRSNNFFPLPWVTSSSADRVCSV